MCDESFRKLRQSENTGRMAHLVSRKKGTGIALMHGVDRLYYCTFCLVMTLFCIGKSFRCTSTNAFVFQLGLLSESKWALKKLLLLKTTSSGSMLSRELQNKCNNLNRNVKTYVKHSVAIFW